MSTNKKPSGAVNRKRKFLNSKEDEKQSNALRKFFTVVPSCEKIKDQTLKLTEFDRNNDDKEKLQISELLPGPSKSQESVEKVNEDSLKVTERSTLGHEPPGPSTSTTQVTHELKNTSIIDVGGSNVQLQDIEEKSKNTSTIQVSLSQIDLGVISDSIFQSPVPLRPGDEEKRSILHCEFVPDSSFEFPKTQFGKKKLRFQHSWLQKWAWLAYSKSKDGAYCKYCILFSSECLGKADLSVKNAPLVGKPFKKWKDALEKFKDHSDRSYHKSSIISAENFLKVTEGETLDVAAIIDNKRKREKEENRAALLPIIETVIFCGENELPLRGDIDSGPLSLEKPLNKDGKFRALIRYRAGHDDNLLNHVLSCPKNASYLSPDIQNEIIEICGKLVQKNILLKINQAECFSIIGDETLDVSGQEQLSVCFRYVTNEEHSSLREDFISFFPITNLSADNIADKILKICNDLGVDLENKLIGQGYDGASTMSGVHNGVQARIQEKYPKAMYVHCSSHRLNLVLSDTLSVPIINNGLGVLNEVTQFFRHNAQAGNMLKENVKRFCPESKKSRLLKLCETRFIERQDSLNSFVELVPAILPTLSELTELNKSFSTTASTLLAAMEKGSFIISMLVCEYIFNITLPLSAYLQDPQRDLAAAVSFCDDIVSRLQAIRAGPQNETEFRKIFQNAENMAEFVFGTAIEVPRQAKTQTRRDNPPHSSPEEYFRRTVFVPAIDNLISNLINRFDKNREFLCVIDKLLPQNCLFENTMLLEKLQLYFEDKVSESTLKSEYVLWCQKWKSVDKQDRPTKLMHIIDSCNKSFYPTIRHLLCILAALPVSTCEAERSFSSMKRIKTFLRNRMGNDRLTGLALMSTHYPVPFNAEDVLNVMAVNKKRRMVL